MHVNKRVSAKGGRPYLIWGKEKFAFLGSDISRFAHLNGQASLSQEKRRGAIRVRMATGLATRSSQCVGSLGENHTPF